MPRSRWIEAAAAGAALVFFRLYRPEQDPAWVLCGFRWLTGLPCPFCGLTRGLCAAAKGQWLEAFQFHALSPLVLAILSSWLALSVASAPLRLRRWQGTLVAAFLIYGALRIAALTL